MKIMDETGDRLNLRIGNVTRERISKNENVINVKSSAYCDFDQAFIVSECFRDS